jgi:hypothetical protein
MKRFPTLVVAAAATLAAAPAAAQTVPVDDPVLRAIWAAGMERSQVGALGQVLMDSLGPRLPGTPESEAALEWAEETYERWNIDAQRERYGTWLGWRRGVTHVDLLEPRVRTLDGMLLAWSPGTAEPVIAPVIAFPPLPATREEFSALVRGRIVLTSPPQPSCRPTESWEEWGRPETVARMSAERDSAQARFARRLAPLGGAPVSLGALAQDAGAVGIVTSDWPDGWGVVRTHTQTSPGATAPRIGLSCEDYNLLWRLAENDQGPVVRIRADAELLGEVPVANLIGRIEGRELSNEYVMLSAHFDSWDGASGATDNGAGTVTMMEAMRILKEAYPRPRRTILVGHWNGEEQGLNGSRAYAADHPEVVAGLQVLLNQDIGTGRVTDIGTQGLAEASPVLQRWLARIPRELAAEVTVDSPGRPSASSDHAAFICGAAPAFFLGQASWEYGEQTWHTTLDTYDKLVVDELKNNATLIAMLAYLASEDPERIPRTQAVLPVDQGSGQPAPWPTCRDGARSSGR